MADILLALLCRACLIPFAVRTHREVGRRQRPRPLLAGIAAARASVNALVGKFPYGT